MGRLPGQVALTSTLHEIVCLTLFWYSVRYRVLKLSIQSTRLQYGMQCTVYTINNHWVYCNTHDTWEIECTDSKHYKCFTEKNTRLALISVNYLFLVFFNPFFCGLEEESAHYSNACYISGHSHHVDCGSINMFNSIQIYIHTQPFLS